MALLFSGSQLEAHAFLDGVLEGSDQDYDTLPPEAHVAYEAGLVQRGEHPLAECRVVVLDDGDTSHEVHSDPRGGT